MPQNPRPKAELRGAWGSFMRVLLSTYGSRGDVEPMLGLAVQLRALGAQVQVCAPPNFAERVAEVGVELVPVGQSARTLATGQAADLFAGQFDAASAVTAAATGCDALVATGMIPAAAGVRSCAEKLGIGYVYATFQQLMLPSPHHPPLMYPGRPFPPERTDATSINALFREALNTHRATIGLAPVADVRDYVRDDVIGKRPWLATDPILDPWQASPDIDVVQTGAWIQPDERPLPADVEAFLDAGTPPVYVGFGSMPMRESTDVARVAIEAIRAHGRRSVVARGWADLTLTDDGDDCIGVGEVNQQALFCRVAAVVHHGGAGTTTTAARAGAPQVVIPQAADQPYWARRVAELGIGAAHEGPTPTVESLSDALETALSAETRARASAVAGTIRADGARVAATLLLDAAGHQIQPEKVRDT